MDLYDLDTPALVVDLDRLERNIGRMAALAKETGTGLRPHTKTHKTPEIARMQIAAGAVGLTIAKLGEAEVMADAGFDDLFMANQVVGAAKVERWIALVRRVRLIVGVDSVETAEPLDAAARRAGLRAPVRVEFDTGLHRAGVRTLEELGRLAARLVDMDGLEVEGLFTYEGHANKPDVGERAASAAAAASRMREAADVLRQHGLPIRSISMGSTPASPYTARQPGVTEIRPGTYVFLDQMQTGLGSALEDCALTVLATVVSRPDDATAILDSGTKSLSGDRGAEGSRHGLLLDDTAVVFDWANEEHGHLDLTAARLRPRVGDKLRVVPYHVCACVNMHDTIYGVRDGHVEALWTVAGRGKIR